MKGQDIRHLDEARDQLIKDLKAAWKKLKVVRVLVIEDAFGRFSLGVWGKQTSEKSITGIMQNISPFNSGSIFWAPETPDAFDPLDLEQSWEEASSIEGEGDWDEKLRITVRHRMLSTWQRLSSEPLWPLGKGECPIVGFYSFKGGMGRTTSLLAFALDRVLRNESVVIVDLDLDAPGLGSFFRSTDRESPYGVVDYLIEFPVLGKRPADLLEYSSTVDLGTLRTTGSLRVFPAGRMDRHYLGKVSRLDFETESRVTAGARHPIEELLLHIREKFQPNWILVDSRTGFSETAGMLLSGICHFHVLLGVDSDQSWEGMAYAISRLGAERLERDMPQAEALVVHAMIPKIPLEQRQALLDGFRERSQDAFREKYYAQDEDKRDDRFWYLSDETSRPNPHKAWSLPYREDLAQSFSVAGLRQALIDSVEFKEYCQALAARVKGEDLPESEA